MAPPSVYELTRLFDPQNKFDGTNYRSWTTEVEMTFGEDPSLLSHITTASTRPTESDKRAIWQATDTSARTALYKTISSNPIRSVHFKTIAESAGGPQTANQVWLSLKAEYQKDSRAARFDLKKRLYNPVHDISKPVSDFVADINAAYESLVALGHSPAPIDVVDSILMNLDPSFSIVRTLLTTQTEEPKLDAVKKLLTDQEDDRQVLGELTTMESAMYSKSRRGKNSKDSEGPPYDWLNPKGNDVCHRCGLPGHRSSRCVADMPQHIKDKIFDELRKKRDDRHEESHLVRTRFLASDSEEGEPESDDDEAEFSNIYRAKNNKSPTALMARLRF